MNELIKTKLADFILNVKDKSVYEKKLCHYNSTINLAEGLTNLSDNDERHEKFKNLILNYFERLEAFNYLIDIEYSFELFKKYLQPVGIYLISKKQYSSKWDIFKYIGFGLLLDVILYNFYGLYFFITPVFYIIGLIRRKKKIKEKRFFNIRW